MYVDRKLVSVETIESLLAFDVICWWYAVNPVAVMAIRPFGTVGSD